LNACTPRVALDGEASREAPGGSFLVLFSKKNFFLPLPGKASLEFRRYVKRQLHPGFHDFYW
jgi:hypothetical protein